MQTLFSFGSRMATVASSPAGYHRISTHELIERMDWTHEPGYSGGGIVYGLCGRFGTHNCEHGMRVWAPEVGNSLSFAAYCPYYNGLVPAGGPSGPWAMAGRLQT